jgi:hypothetical protein
MFGTGLALLFHKLDDSMPAPAKKQWTLSPAGSSRGFANTRFTSALARLGLVLFCCFLPQKAWAQPKSPVEAVRPQSPIEAVRIDTAFETALQGYKNSINGAASLYFDAWATAIDRFRDQLDKVKEDPKSTIVSSVIGDQISGLVGKIPVIGDTVKTVAGAASGDTKARAAGAASSELGRFLQRVGTEGWKEQAQQFITSTRDEQLNPVRERYEELRKTYVEALRRGGPPGAGGDPDNGEGQPKSGRGPCPNGTEGTNAVQDLRSIIDREADNKIEKAERALHQYIQKISKTKYRKPNSELVDSIELRLYASYFKKKGAIFVVDLSNGPPPFHFQIKTADVPSKVYERVWDLTKKIEGYDFTRPWAPQEPFDIPLWRVSVQAPKPGDLLQVPQARHELILPSEWSAAERSQWLKANPEYKRLAAAGLAVTKPGIANYQFTSKEAKAFRDHVLFSKPVPRQ